MSSEGGALVTERRTRGSLPRFKSTENPTRGLFVMLKINGKPVEATHVAWDGCHKFFLIADDEDEGTVRDCGYTDADIYPVEDIPDLWEQSCFLKAIWWPWTSDRETLVEQGDDEPVFEVVS